MALVGAATNYSAILRPLQWLVVVLIFLFFLRVVRAVWVEVRPAGPRQSRSGTPRAAREAEIVATGAVPVAGATTTQAAPQAALLGSHRASIRGREHLSPR